MRVESSRCIPVRGDTGSQERHVADEQLSGVQVWRHADTRHTGCEPSNAGPMAIPPSRGQSAPGRLRDRTCGEDEPAIPRLPPADVVRRVLRALCDPDRCILRSSTPACCLHQIAVAQDTHEIPVLYDSETANFLGGHCAAGGFQVVIR